MKYILTEEQLNKVEDDGIGPLNDIIKKLFMMHFPDFESKMFVHYAPQSDDYFLIFPETYFPKSVQENIINKLRKILGPVDIIIFNK